jgi:spore maturation protein CgeB
VPGAEALAQDKVHCRWYRSPAEASEVLAELLADPVEREAMAARGRDYVRAHHSYDQRLGVILGERTSV